MGSSMSGGGDDEMPLLLRNKLQGGEVLGPDSLECVRDGLPCQSEPFGLSIGRDSISAKAP